MPELVLWLWGVGVEVGWIAPRSPRQNATVERMQRTTGQWAEPESCSTGAQLQQRLDHLVDLQTKHYPVQRKQGKSRQQLYPSLWANPRRYQKSSFQIQRVYTHLQKLNFVRRVSNNGCFSFYSQSVHVGDAYKNQDLSLSFNQKKMCWNLTNQTGVCFATIPAENFSKCAVEQLNVCRKRSLKATKLPVAKT